MVVFWIGDWTPKLSMNMLREVGHSSLRRGGITMFKSTTMFCGLILFCRILSTFRLNNIL